MSPPSALLRTRPPPSRRPPTSRGTPGYRAYPASAAFATGRGRFLQLLDLPCVTVLSLPPRRSVLRHRSECRRPCCLRPGPRGSAFGEHFFRGHWWVHLRYGPVTRSPSQKWLGRLASSASFPPRMQPELRGSCLFPRWDCLPLNMPALAGRTGPQEFRPPIVAFWQSPPLQYHERDRPAGRGEAARYRGTPRN